MTAQEQLDNRLTEIIGRITRDTYFTLVLHDRTVGRAIDYNMKYKSILIDVIKEYKEKSGEENSNGKIN